MKTFLAWLIANRASPRAAFGLRMACMGTGVVLSLVWTRAILRVLGSENFGLLTSFSAFLAIAGAGDLGMGGAVGIRTNQIVAAGDEAHLRRFHAVARTTFVATALGVAALVFALSPWLPGWLHFEAGTARGSLSALFAVGAMTIGISIFGSYLNNASYGAGTVAWGVLPSFLATQLTSALQVALGLSGSPLWVLQLASMLVMAGNTWVLILIFRHSHPVFAGALPWRLGRPELLELGRTSFWAYLFGLFFLIYTSTDRLIINAFFGAKAVAVFHLNNRLPELALSVVGAAAFVSLPKVTNLLLSPEAADAAQGRRLAAQLGQAQAFLALAAVLAYLLGNDFFVRWIFGPEYLGPLSLQFAFGAAVLMVSNGDVYLQLAAKLSPGGLRLTALSLLATGLLNLGLSVLSAKYLRSMAGVGWATMAAHLLVFGIVTRHMCGQYAFLGWGKLLARSVVAPMSVYAAACAGKLWLGRSGPLSLGGLAIIYGVLLFLYASWLGPTPAELGQSLRTGWRTVTRRAPPPGSPDGSSHPAALP